MSRLELLLILYNSGLVIQWGFRRHGLYPLRWLGRLLLRHHGKKRRIDEKLAAGEMGDTAVGVR